MSTLKFMLFLLIFSKLFDLHNAYVSENSMHAVSTETQGGNMLWSLAPGLCF